MYKLVLPSARELLIMQTAGGITSVAELSAAEHILSCALSHIWFYVLDEKLDGVPNAGQRFLSSIEQYMIYNPEEPDPRTIGFLSNYERIVTLIFRVTNMMSCNLDILMAKDPTLRNFSNSCSYLDMIDNSFLVITFFNNAFERDEYVRRKTSS